MQTLRNILKIGPAGATLSDEYGSDSGIALELMMGTEVTLEFDLREDRPSASSALPDYPPEKLVSASYYCAVDAGCVGTDQPMLLQISGITLGTDSDGHTVLTVPIASTAATGLSAALFGHDSCDLYCEIGGLNTGGTAVFAWQFPITVRNRLFSGSGTQSVAEDPAYYTAAQVEAVVARQLHFEYSADGESWHALRADGDTLLRVRHGENGIPSAAMPLVTGPQGEKGDKGDKGDIGEPLMTYLVGGTDSDITMDLAGGTHWTFAQPLTGLTIASVENSHYESEIVFKGGTTLSVAYPITVGVIGEPSFEPGKSYIINVRDGILVAGEYTPGADTGVGIWYYDAGGHADTTTCFGQTYLAGATISGGTLTVNPGAVVDSVGVEDYAKAVIGGTVGSIIGESSSSVVVIGGTVQNVSSHDLDVTITGGIAVGIACHGAGKISVSEGAVTTILSTQTGDVDISGTALISGLTATNWDDLGFPGPRIAISGGTVDRLHMELIEASEDPMSLTISGGTVGLALATQTGISDGIIDATISETAVIVNLPD